MSRMHCAPLVPFSMFYYQDLSGLKDHEFQVRHPDSPALLYQLRLGDEKLQVKV